MLLVILELPSWTYNPLLYQSQVAHALDTPQSGIWSLV